MGNYTTDHSTWKRPEDSQDERPAFVLDETLPGSDVVGQAAAALAATALAFAPYNRQYSGVVLKEAVALYQFATTYQGIYSNVVPTEGHYWSDSYRDDLAFAACWLYRASGTQQYLKDCEAYWAEHFRVEGAAANAVEWNYNHMIWGVDALLYMTTNKAAYKTRCGACAAAA